MISTEKKTKVVKDLQSGKNDTGSAAVQVGIFTERIRELTEHLKVNKKDLRSNYDARSGRSATASLVRGNLQGRLPSGALSGKDGSCLVDVECGCSSRSSLPCLGDRSRCR